MRIRLGIIDQDDVYKAHLINYFRINYTDEMEIFTFSNQADLQEFLADHQLDVLLSDESSIHNPGVLPAELPFAYWAESQKIHSIRNVPAVCKYQKAKLIYQKILELYTKTSERAAPRNSVETKDCVVVTFTGAAGGVGTSTAAAACALRAARLGKQVLFLDMSCLGNAEWFFHGEGTVTLPETIGATINHDVVQLLNLNSTISRDESGVYFYKPCTMALNLLEEEEKNLQQLLYGLVESHQYDVIVIDVDAAVLLSRKFIAAYSNSVVAISDGQIPSNEKLSKLLKTCKLHDDDAKSITHKLHILYNRFGGGAQILSNLDEFAMLNCIGDYGKYSPAHIAREIASKNIMDKLFCREEIRS